MRAARAFSSSSREFIRLTNESSRLVFMRMWFARTRLSSTLSEWNNRRSWNERAIPRRARLYDGRWVITAPLKWNSPSSGDISPVTRLTIVDLPEPLGPMRPTIWPLSTERLAPSTAGNAAKALA